MDLTGETFNPDVDMHLIIYKFLQRAVDNQEYKALFKNFTKIEDQVGILQSDFAKKIREDFIAFYNDEEKSIQDALTSGNVPAKVKRTADLLKDVDNNLEALRAVLPPRIKAEDISLEDLGIDRLCIDEAHYFKNLYTYSKMTNVAGVNTQSHAEKSYDLFVKCKWINEKTDYKGVVFATGTPISNSATELFTMHTYLRPDILKEQGIDSFDAWASVYGNVVDGYELAPEGTGYRRKSRFKQFRNVPELMGTFKEFTDVQTADMLQLPVPKSENHLVTVKPSAIQQCYIKALAKRARLIRSGVVDKDKDNMLRITHEGRMIALEPRLFYSDFPDNPNSKLNECVKKVREIYNNTKADKSTQIIFCDSGTPKSGDIFDVYNDIKNKLTDPSIEGHVKPNEIAFIHDYSKPADKEELFEKVRKGEVRILLGSTGKLGVGTNVQDKLIAIHDLDVPWRPSDLEQRKGRIVRQGNQNEKVDIYRYVTEETFDSYMWQLIESKQRVISQVMTSKNPARCIDDTDEIVLSYAEIKALATGNPFVIEKVNKDDELRLLQIEERQYLVQHAEQTRLLEKVYPKSLAKHQKLYDAIKADFDKMKSNVKHDDQGNEVFSITINDKTITDPKEAGKMLSKVAAILTHEGRGATKRIHGEYLGMKMEFGFDDFKHPCVSLLGQTVTTINIISSNAEEDIRRFTNIFATLNNELKRK